MLHFLGVTEWSDAAVHLEVPPCLSGTVSGNRVSLAVATATEHAPIDFELYLPECWANDPVRRRKARIPDEVTFRTKPELALAMIERAALAGIPGEIILADSAYGDVGYFRSTVRLLGFDYAVGIQRTPRSVELAPTGNSARP